MASIKKSLDLTTTLQSLKEKVEEITVERDWVKFHNPKNVAMNLAIEAGELMEHFVWTPDPEVLADLEKKREDIEDEVADVLFSILLFANRSSIDISSVFYRKVKKIEEKYPVEKVKGKRLKYTEY